MGFRGILTAVQYGVAGGLLACPAAAMAAVGASIAVAPTPSLYITTEASPPASLMRGGEVVGFSTDKVREIMARAGIAYSIQILPWMRAYTEAIQRPNGCVFSTTRTPEREALFKWVGPTDQADWILLARADKRLRITSLEDVRGMRIGTYFGDARDEYLRARGFLVDPAQNDLINPRKLLLNRIDLWAASYRRGKQVLEKNGWARQIVPVFTFAQVKVYLACNRAIPDALVDKMNAALESMERDGTLRKLEQKYDSLSSQP